MSTATSVTTTAKNLTPEVEPLTCAIGAEVKNVNLGVAARDHGLMAEIRSLLLQYKVLFFRDQDISRAEHVAFARHFGELEDHPVAATLNIPASCASTNRPMFPMSVTRTPGTAMRPGVRSRR